MHVCLGTTGLQIEPIGTAAAEQEHSIHDIHYWVYVVERQTHVYICMLLTH